MGGRIRGRILLVESPHVAIAQIECEVRRSFSSSRKIEVVFVSKKQGGKLSFALLLPVFTGLRPVQRNITNQSKEQAEGSLI